MSPDHAIQIREQKRHVRVLGIIELVTADWIAGYNDGIDGKDAAEQDGEYKIGHECGRDARWEILA